MVANGPDPASELLFGIVEFFLGLVDDFFRRSPHLDERVESTPRQPYNDE